MKIVVTGSRHYSNRAHVFASLDALHAEVPITRLAHGDATGADTLCKEWAVARGIEQQPYPYMREFGKAGGPIRNRRMLETERPALLVAFYGEKGTNGCCDIAQTLGIDVRVIPEPSHAWSGAPGIYCTRCFVEAVLESAMACDQCRMAMQYGDPPDELCAAHQAMANAQRLCHWRRG